MNVELKIQKFYEINSRFLEIFETRKPYNWLIDVTPLRESKPYLIYGYFVTSVNTTIEAVNDGDVSVSELYSVFDEFLDFAKNNFIKPIIFEHLNLDYTESGSVNFVVIYKTYGFGLN